MIKHWAFMALPLLVLGACASDSDERCPRARRAAAATLTAAEWSVNRALEDAKEHATQMREVYDDVREGAAKLESSLRRVEQSMGCFSAQNCCTDFGAFTTRERAHVWSMAMTVWEVALPIEVAPVVNDLKDTLNEAEKLGGMTPAAATTWCTTARTRIESTRKAAPSAWTRALFVASKDVDAANAAVELAKRRVHAHASWAHAVTTSGKTTIAPDLGLGGDDFVSARDAIETYVEVCGARGAQIASRHGAAL